MRRFRDRPLEALSLLALSALVTAFVAFAPLYDRAMLHEATAQQLAEAPATVTDLSLTSTGKVDLRDLTPWHPPRPIDDLDGLVPDRIRPYYHSADVGYSADATITRGPRKSAGLVLTRPDACQFVTITAGSCPTRPGEILVSNADTDSFDIRTGDRIEVAGAEQVEERPDGFRDIVDRKVELTVVGTYDATAPGDRWFGHRLGGRSGTVAPGPPVQTFHDAWITTMATFATAGRTPLPTEESHVALALDQRAVGPEDVALVADEIDRLREELRHRARDVTVESGLRDVATNVAAQSDQARVTVPLLMLQLALLSLIALGLALGAAARERRPEVALARLRGRGRSGARRFVVRDLLLVVLAGVPPGAALALLGCWLAQRWLLLGGDRLPGLSWRFAGALALAAGVLAATVLVTAHRTSREPVASLLRRVPARQSRWAPGLLAAVTLTAAASALVAIIAGGVTGPVALATPALLAVTASVPLAHLVGPATGLVGRRLLRNGHLVGSVALLNAARSGSAARTVAMVTVAASLAVFAANALAVGSRNWTAAAEQEVGAAVVVPTSGGTVAEVRAAAAAADPTGDHVTPVVRISPVGTDAPETLAVLPSSFARVALFPGGAPPEATWPALAPPDAAPLRFTGTRATIRVGAGDLRASAADGESVPWELKLTLRTPTDPARTIRIGEHFAAGTVTRVGFAVPCAEGCTLIGIRFDTVAGSRMSGSVSLRDFRVDGVATPLDGEDRWYRIQPPGLASSPTSRGGGLRIELRSEGEPTLELTPRWLPTTVPVLATEALAEVSESSISELVGLDGLRVQTALVDTVTHVPASGQGAVIANLAALERIAPGIPDGDAEIWLDSPSQLAAVERALTDRGLTVGAPRTVAAVDHDQRTNTAAWSLRLSIVVGALGLFMAGLVLLIVAAAGWRANTRDLAALRLSGMAVRPVRRLAVTAQLPPVLLGVAAGTVSGLLGAQIALPIVPLFVTDPEVSVLDLDTAWSAVALAAVISLAVLAATAAVAGVGLARRATADRVREAL